VSIAAGLYGATQGAKTASAISTPNTISEIIASLCLRNRRHAVALVDSERTVLDGGLAAAVVMKPLMKGKA
jgi:hypothetical protein